MPPKLPDEIAEMFPDDEEDLNSTDGNERDVSEDGGDEQIDESDGLGESERLDEDAVESEDDSGRDEGQDFEGRQSRVDTWTNDQLNSRQRRSQNHYQKLRGERDNLRAELDRIQAEKAASDARWQQEEAMRARARQAQEQQRLEQMLPEERNSYELQQIKAQLNYQEQMRAFERADIQDKANYDAQASVKPLYKRHAVAVEKALADCRKAGQNIAREALLRYCIGDEVLKNSEKNSKPLNPQRSRKVPRPTNSRADVSDTQRNRKPSSERERILKQWGDTPL